MHEGPDLLTVRSSDPRGLPVSKEDWEEQYRTGRWNYLEGTLELGRYAVIAGYVAKYSSDASLVDVGCGECVLWDYLNPSQIAHYTGIDLSSTALAKVKIPPDKRTLIACDLDAFEPSPDAAFDAIVFNEVLYYSKLPMRALERFRASLKSNGVIVVSMWHSPDPNSAHSRTVDKIWRAIDQGPWKGLDETAVTNIPTRRTWRIRAMSSAL